MLASFTVEDKIREAISRDVRIPDPDDVAVLAADGTVTLRGTVGSYPQRQAAVRDARAVDPEYVIRDELTVRLLDRWQRSDAEIRGVALQILMWDVEVPSETVDVEVEDGWITLRGEVEYEFQSNAAYEDVTGLAGVCGITNAIRVANPA